MRSRQVALLLLLGLAAAGMAPRSAQAEYAVVWDVYFMDGTIDEPLRVSGSVLTDEGCPESGYACNPVANATVTVSLVDGSVGQVSATNNTATTQISPPTTTTAPPQAAPALKNDPKTHDKNIKAVKLVSGVPSSVDVTSQENGIFEVFALSSEAGRMDLNASVAINGTVVSTPNTVTVTWDTQRYTLTLAPHYSETKVGENETMFATLQLGRALNRQAPQQAPGKVNEVLSDLPPVPNQVITFFREDLTPEGRVGTSPAKDNKPHPTTKPSPQQKVGAKLVTEIGNATTDGAGVATIQLTSDVPALTIVTAEFVDAYNKTWHAEFDALVSWYADVPPPTLNITADSYDIIVGKPVTVTVTARDAEGKPVPGIFIVFDVTGDAQEVAPPAPAPARRSSGGGRSLLDFSTIVPTDDNGVASIRLAAKSAGVITVIASLNGVVYSDTLTLTASEPPAPIPNFSAIELRPLYQETRAGTAAAITATVLDADNNPASNITVDFSMQPANAQQQEAFARGLVTPDDTSATTDADGKATIKLQSLGPLVVAVRATGMNSAGELVSSCPVIVNFVAPKRPHEDYHYSHPHPPSYGHGPEEPSYGPHKGDAPADQPPHQPHHYWEPEEHPHKEPHYPHSYPHSKYSGKRPGRYYY